MSESMIIRLAGLAREYRMDAETVPALRGVALEIRRNEYVAIIGPPLRRTAAPLPPPAR